MEAIKAIALGLIQGLSEFLPISSSGHLVLAEELLNFKEGGLVFEVFVHFGTLLAVLWVFRREILKMFMAIPFIPRLRGNNLPAEKREYALLTLFILIGSVPAAVIGLLFENAIEQLFESHVVALGMLFITGLIMWSSRYTHENREDMNGFHSLLIGFAQAFAIIPGISRSGSTIVTGLWLGIPRRTVARFSFLLSAPVIFGATVIKTKDLFESIPPAGELVNLALATGAAAVSGYLAIVWMLELIQKQKLEWFGVYCILVSLVGLIFVMFV